MSATNQTPNYGLPQYVGTDVPSYLGDFNIAMLDIDTAIKGVDNKATSTESSVATANANASEALENANQASTKAENAQATATQAQTTATTAKNTADTAQSTANTANESANTNTQSIANMKKWTSLGNISTNGTGGNINAYINKELNLLNIYGRTNGLTGTGTNVKIGSLPENARPKATRRINGVAFAYYGTGASQNLILFDLDILTNGDIVIPDNVTETIYSLRMNCVLNTTGWF